MVKFKRIIVENYKSIEYAELDFRSGIYKVVGDNQDNTYTSNGAGKSSILQAIVLGLYNKDFTGAPLDSLSNRSTGKPYHITIEFLAMHEGKEVDVTITNPAGAVRMRSFINGELVGTGSVTVIPLVEKLLGMGYNTFKITHFITSSTITNLVQNLSQPTLFNDILHIVELQELDKKLLQAYKVLNTELEDIKVKVQKAEQQNKLKEFKFKYNLDSITNDISIAEAQLDSLDYECSELLSELTQQKDKASASVTQLEQLIDNTRTTLREGICSMCGHILVDQSKLQELNDNLAVYISKVGIARADLDEATGKLQVLNKKYLDQRQELLNQLSLLGGDLNTAKEVESIDVEDIDPSSITILSDLEEQTLFINTARKEIKSGKVIKNILEQFFGIVSVKLQEYSELIRLDHFDVRIANDKLGMAILLQQNGIDVPIDSLSNGEKTRLSLLVLIAMLDSMKLVSESETNLVILDEAASSFDKSGIEELGNLFAHLKSLGQSIFIITHGSEMDQVAYDYELLVTKSQGSAHITIQEL